MRSGALPEEAGALFQRFVRNGTFVDPTLVVLERLENRLAAGLPDPDWQHLAVSARAEGEKFFRVRYDAGPQARSKGADLRELQAVTRMMDDAGRIAAGMRADLVLLESNPLIDIRNARRIRSVILAGKVLDRPALDRLLAQALALATRH